MSEEWAPTLTDTEHDFGPDDSEDWAMHAYGYLDRRADNYYGDGHWSCTGRRHWWSQRERWMARCTYRPKAVQAH